MATHQTQTRLLRILALIASLHHVHPFSMNRKYRNLPNWRTVMPSRRSSIMNTHSNYPPSWKNRPASSVERQWAKHSLVNDIAEKEGNQDFYGASAWSFGLLSALLLLMPDRTLSKRMASKLGGAGGFGLASFVFYVLSKSFRYEQEIEYVSFQKRCQLALVGFCALGLLSFPGEASFWPTAFPAVLTSILMIVVRTGGLVVALRGWIRGCKDLRWHKELRYGFLDNCRGLKVQDKKKSLFYRNSVFVIFFVMVSNTMEAIFQYRYRDALELSSFAGSLHISAVSRLFLVSSLLFSLKLASESDSFPSHVTWQMNWALAAWAGLVGIGQSVKFHPSLQVAVNRIEMLTLSALLFIKGLKIFLNEPALIATTPKPDDTSNSELEAKEEKQ